MTCFEGPGYCWDVTVFQNLHGPTSNSHQLLSPVVSSLQLIFTYPSIVLCCDLSWNPHVYVSVGDQIIAWLSSCAHFGWQYIWQIVLPKSCGTEVLHLGIRCAVYPFYQTTRCQKRMRISDKECSRSTVFNELEGQREYFAANVVWFMRNSLFSSKAVHTSWFFVSVKLQQPMIKNFQDVLCQKLQHHLRMVVIAEREGKKHALWSWNLGFVSNAQKCNLQWQA